METDRWQQVDRIFEDALDLEGAELAAFLDSACGGDAGLRAEVESLIAADGRLGNFMEDPTFTVVDGAYLLQREDPWIGRRLGSYELLRERSVGSAQPRIQVVYDMDSQPRYGAQAANEFFADRHTGIVHLAIFEIELVALRIKPKLTHELFLLFQGGLFI